LVTTTECSTYVPMPNKPLQSDPPTAAGALQTVQFVYWTEWAYFNLHS